MIKKPLLLVVDNNRTSRETLILLLKRNYDIGVAADGYEALHYAKKCPPDIILLDIVMPGIDGYEVCRQLKRDSSTKNIPVIFITALDNAKEQKNAFEAGAVDFIPKPFQPMEVRARIQTRLDFRRAIQERDTHNAELKNTLEDLNIQKQILEQRSEQMKKSSETVVNFLSNLSYKIHSFMDDIIGRAELMLFEEGLSEEHREHINSISTSANELLSTSDKVMDETRERYDKQRTSILIVDDNEINRNVIIKNLEKAGYQTDALANGKQAIKVLESISYDLVLMGMRMPEMTGPEATRIIRDKNSKILDHNIPIITMTAADKDAYKKLYEQKLIDGYIFLPLNADDLLSTIENILAKPR
jgi:CheY-like chemotaxis protein